MSACLTLALCAGSQGQKVHSAGAARPLFLSERAEDSGGNAQPLNAGQLEPIGDVARSQDRSVVPIEPAPSKKLSLQGTVGYRIDEVWKTAVITVDRVRNTRDVARSGIFQLTLLATSRRPVLGLPIHGLKLASLRLEELQSGHSLGRVRSETMDYTAPPQGVYYITLALLEYANSRWLYQDFYGFAEAIHLNGVGTSPLPTACAPETSKPATF